MSLSVKHFVAMGLLLGTALGWSQPLPDPQAGAEMVELVRLVPGLRLDVRYASSRNFMQRPLYPQARVFLRREVAAALARVQAGLQPRGFSLLVFDGYRPWHVTKAMWDEVPPQQRAFVADPASGSRHNRGGAVDLTLWDLARGRPVEMTSAYDEFSPRAAANYPGTPRACRNRDLLRQSMQAEGFQVLSNEWWHFDYRDWAQFPLLNYSFQELDNFRKKSPG